MNNNDIKLKDTIEKLIKSNIIPEKNISETLYDIENLKQKLKPLTKEELSVLLDKIPTEQINLVKKTLTESGDKQWTIK